MNQEKSKWQKRYEKGEINFIMYFGILKRGILLTFLLSGCEYIWKYGLHFSHFDMYLCENWFRILFRIVFFGVSLGHLNWKRMEKDLIQSDLINTNKMK